jgi:tetratricopeptide (TPR) repeat protein
MFYNYNGTTLQINCQVVPNTDVSGVGVRWALFLQAFTTIVLSALALEPSEILMTNISAQGTSLALIAATFFDPTVDIVHSIITSQFAVLFSISRITTLDIPVSLPRTRTSMKMFSRLQLFDLFFRTCLLSFNIQLWSTILKIQSNDLCPTYAGSWSFFFKRFDLTDPSSASTFAFAYCIIDIVWEFLRYCAVAIEKCLMDPSRTKAQKSWDPRIRVMSALADVFKIPETIQLKFKLSTFVRRVPVFYKVCTLVYVSVNILQSVNDNGLTGENYWTFGQIFTMVNMVGTLAVLISHFMPSTISASSRFISRYMLAQTSIAGAILVATALGSGALGWYLYARYLLRYGDHTGFLYALISVGHIFGVMVVVILCMILMLFVCLLLTWIFLNLLTPVNNFIAPAILRVARVMDRAWRAVEEYFRWIVSSDRVSKAIEMKELSLLDLCSNQRILEWRWVERKAHAHEKSGDLVLAIEEWGLLSEASRCNGDWWPHYQMARLYEKLGDFERATQLWEELVLADDQKSWHSLAIARLERAYTIGRGPEGAIEAWKDLIMANPSKTSVLNSAAQILRAQAAYTTSIEIFGKLSEMDAENKLAKMLLARAYESKGDHEQALALRRKIWDQFRDESAETALALSYVIFLIEEGCKKCREARIELDPWYKCKMCDRYIGGLTKVKVRVRDELVKSKARSSLAELRKYFESM